MNRLALLLALTLCFPLAAHADDASRRAKADELILLLRMDRTVNQIMDNLLQQSGAIAMRKAGGKLSPESQAALSDFQKKLAAVIEPQIGWKAVESDYVKFYADGFTEEELDTIVAFYKSPAGKALLDKAPTINAQATQLLQSKINAIQPEIKQMFVDFDKSQSPQAPPSLTAPPATTPPAPAKATPK